MSIKVKIRIVAILLIAVIFSTLYGQRPADSNSPSLGIEITTNVMNNPLRIPINTIAGKKQMFATVPVKDKTGEVSAARIVPVFEDGKIKLDISYLSGDYWKAESCADIQLLKINRAETKIIEKDETLNLLKTADDKDSPIIIKMITFQDRTDSIPSPEGCGCATCGRQNPLHCCPAKGACMGCGNCGEVCCPNG